MMNFNEFTAEMELLFGFHSRNPMRAVIKAWWTLAEVTPREQLLIALKSLRVSTDNNNHFPVFNDFRIAICNAKSGILEHDGMVGCDYCVKGYVYYDDHKGRGHVAACSLCRMGPQGLNAINPKLVDSRYKNGGALDGQVIVNMKNRAYYATQAIKIKEVKGTTHWQDREDYREANISKNQEE